MEKKMTENGPSIRKLAFLAIFTTPYPTKPYKTCINFFVWDCRKRGKKDDWKRTIGSEVSILANIFHFSHKYILEFDINLFRNLRQMHLIIWDKKVLEFEEKNWFWTQPIIEKGCFDPFKVLMLQGVTTIPYTKNVTIS